MRSSIACARCRRSKIKCVNAGIDTTCRACESSGRECIYPTPAIGVGGATAKRDIAALADGDDRNGDADGPKRQRPRKSVAVSSSAAKDAARGILDALESSILTVKVWEAVFDLFQSHFATVLPFLHPATFMGNIRQLLGPQPSSSSTAPTNQENPGEKVQSPPAAKSDPNPLIPLGVLALTARFHPQLIAYHSPPSQGNPSNPVLASEFYATALRSRLAGVDGASLTVPELTRVQALLMLALHEWGMCRGKSAWLYVGMAIRLSQAMGLPYELENDIFSRDGPRSPSAFRTEAELFGVSRRGMEPKEQTSDDVIAQETKRRTFWACFILDRCLSSGKYRPRMIRVKELAIQLPSDNAFAFGERVRTSRLCEAVVRRPQSFGAQGVQIPSIRQSLGFGDDKLPNNITPDPKSWSPISRRKDSSEDEIDRWEIGAEEPVLSRVIRIIRIWGSIAKWSCAGGRRTEQLPPWHPDSRFSRLKMILGDFQDGLSRNLQYSTRNTDTHIMYKNNLPPYTLMHVVYFLSVLVLHRAYIPFLPVRCTEPVGPLDEPLFPGEKVGVPDGFWRESARELFNAARQMMNLVVTCQERGVLVENPLVGFAVYNAAFIGIYAAHFPHMDPEGVLGSKPTCGGDGNQGGQAQIRKALDILREMRTRLKMARGWFRTLNRLHSYFSKVKQDFRRQSRKLDSIPEIIDLQTNGFRPVREGGAGGGLEEFKLLEKLFLDFGSIEDQLPENGADEDGAAGVSDRVTNISDAGSNAVRSDPGETVEASLDGAGGRRESWVPINSPGMPLPGPDGERRPSLPLPPSRSLQSQSPFSLPSLQHHPDGPLYNNSSPTLPVIGPTGSYGGPPSTTAGAASSQYSAVASQSGRLQPLNQWLSSRQQPPPPPYSQSLPPINAATSQGLPLLPLPGSVHPTASPPATVDGMESFTSNSLWSTSLGGDDVLAFLEGCEYDQLPGDMPSEGGWLTTVWTEFTR
ncbi:fungal-specific transcription factor domain-containing protein [Aspergillus coremiiformis]|uniref:Fungal-specific transcription factor domain-containing protein n=1 Tax=Aspergillus coremiiformis TaxID=138285 RepID=A0A5N6ZEZ0_9EURO|nr:fungal-specific transcription factor domain-containing protein [Aspergillus coremiiformis]